MKKQVSDTPDFSQEKFLKKNLTKQFADLNFPKIMKYYGKKQVNVSRNYTHSEFNHSTINSKNTIFSSRRNMNKLDDMKKGRDSYQ